MTAMRRGMRRMRRPCRCRCRCRCRCIMSCVGRMRCTACVTRERARGTGTEIDRDHLLERDGGDGGDGRDRSPRARRRSLVVVSERRERMTRTTRTRTRMKTMRTRERRGRWRRDRRTTMVSRGGGTRRAESDGDARAAFELVMETIEIADGCAVRLVRPKSEDEVVDHYVAAGTLDSDPYWACLLYTSPSPRDKRQSRMPSSA